MNYNFDPESEKRVLQFWTERKIFDKLRKKLKKSKKRFSFLDGPITANNPMGVHHAWGRTYKDVFQRHKAMKGFDQRFQNGFDCQGLWVEVEVEKELGFKSKKDIEKFGIGNFVEKCKERVKKYSAIQTNQSVRLGQWMDWPNSYYTMSPENNYAIWHFLKKCWEKGWLYKGRDVVPWCPRCGTAISQHEIVTEGYKELTHKSVFVKLPLENGKKHLLIWTTTPWTLAANVAVAVHLDLDYIEAKKDKEILILAEDLLNVIGDDYKIVRKFKGKKLIGLKYTGPFDDLPANKSVKHKIIGWDEVSCEEGTGLVHIAPGCGQEDYELGKKEKLDIIDPVNEESKYREGFDWLSGKPVAETIGQIFEDLKKKGMLFKTEGYTHRYPVCWRCSSELIFRLVDEWYIAMNDLRNPLKKIAKAIKWIPAFGLKREIDWLNNMHDWMVSKKRYWGLALPIFECSCGHFEVIGGYDELKKKAVSGWKEFDGHTPHRPHIDKVKIKCSKCGKEASRIPDVGNPWLDAGIVALSTMGYFKDKKYWRKWFPADLICESFPGQFRNWFYALITMSGVLVGKAPTKTLFGYASVVDEKGEEMHKSTGNAIEFNEGADKIGADVMRWLYVRQNPAADLRFGYGAAGEAKRKLAILWNSFIYFRTYGTDAKIAQISGAEFKKFGLLDRWIVSKLQSAICEMEKYMDEYNVMSASQVMENFFVNDLSTWYIRRSRNRFQKSDDKKDKAIASKVLGSVLLETVKLIAPLTPFMAEGIYSHLAEASRDKREESVHLCDYPKPDKKLIDEKLEKTMKELRNLVTEALALRAEKGIKIRQPLGKLTVNRKKIVENKELAWLIQEEVNIKKIAYGKKMQLDTKITPELKAEGTLRDLIRSIQGMRKDGGLQPGEPIRLRYMTDSAGLKNIFEKFRDVVKNETSAEEIELAGDRKEGFLIEKEVAFDEQKIWFGVKRL